MGDVRLVLFVMAMAVMVMMMMKTMMREKLGAWINGYTERDKRGREISRSRSTVAKLSHTLSLSVFSHPCTLTHIHARTY